MSLLMHIKNAHVAFRSGTRNELHSTLAGSKFKNATFNRGMFELFGGDLEMLTNEPVVIADDLLRDVMPDMNRLICDAHQ